MHEVGKMKLPEWSIEPLPATLNLFLFQKRKLACLKKIIEIILKTCSWPVLKIIFLI
jgi:hypothetical protein